MTTDEFVHKSQMFHGNKYDYSLVDYKNAHTKVKIICPEHGIFEQTPSNHFKCGCNQCGYVSSSDSQRTMSKRLLKLSRTIRQNIYSTYVKSRWYKNNSTKNILGCSWEEFRKHLEDNPYGFKVGQVGIDLDHIVPISSAKTEEDIFKLNHYTNFQLLPRDYNRWIKSCDLFDKNHFEDWLNENKQPECQDF